MDEKKKKIVKTIKVDVDKCNGCRACEQICSAFHAEPKYSIVNPKRSRIRVILDEENDCYVPVLGSVNADAECGGRNVYVVDGKEYSECTFCGVSCPSRDLFREPDSGLPLQCDMCLQEPPLSEPSCVAACLPKALIYEEREEEEEEEPKREDAEIGLEALVNKYGSQKILDAVARMLMSKKS